jgi:hypothetical protein
MLRIEPAGAVLAPGARSSLTGGDGWFRPKADIHEVTEEQGAAHFCSDNAEFSRRFSGRLE